MNDQIQRFFDGLKSIRQDSRELLSLADAFDYTGNSRMAKTLENLSRDLMKQHDILKQVHSEMINEGTKNAQEISGALFKAVMAGKTLVKREKV